MVNTVRRCDSKFNLLTCRNNQNNDAAPRSGRSPENLITRGGHVVSNDRQAVDTIWEGDSGLTGRVWGLRCVNALKQNKQDTVGGLLLCWLCFCVFGIHWTRSAAVIRLFGHLGAAARAENTSCQATYHEEWHRPRHTPSFDSSYK